MRLNASDNLIPVSWKTGDKRRRGRVVGYVTRRRRIHAIVLSKQSFVGVPLDQLKLIRSRSDK